MGGSPYFGKKTNFLGATGSPHRLIKTQVVRASSSATVGEMARNEGACSKALEASWGLHVLQTAMLVLTSGPKRTRILEVDARHITPINYSSFHCIFRLSQYIIVVSIFFSIISI